VPLDFSVFSGFRSGPFFESRRSDLCFRNVYYSSSPPTWFSFDRPRLCSGILLRLARYFVLINPPRFWSVSARGTYPVCTSDTGSSPSTMSHIFRTSILMPPFSMTRRRFQAPKRRAGLRGHLWNWCGAMRQLDDLEFFYPSPVRNLQMMDPNVTTASSRDLGGFPNSICSRIEGSGPSLEALWSMNLPAQQPQEVGLVLPVAFRKRVLPIHRPTSGRAGLPTADFRDWYFNASTACCSQAAWSSCR
jgi:hypothetical protein